MALAVASITSVSQNTERNERGWRAEIIVRTHYAGGAAKVTPHFEVLSPDPSSVHVTVERDNPIRLVVQSTGPESRRPSHVLVRVFGLGIKTRTVEARIEAYESTKSLVNQDTATVSIEIPLEEDLAPSIKSIAVIRSANGRRGYEIVIDNPLGRPVTLTHFGIKKMVSREPCSILDPTAVTYIIDDHFDGKVLGFKLKNVLADFDYTLKSTITKSRCASVFALDGPLNQQLPAANAVYLRIFFVSPDLLPYLDIAPGPGQGSFKLIQAGLFFELDREMLLDTRLP